MGHRYAPELTEAERDAILTVLGSVLACPKVCSEDVAEARILHASGISIVSLAERYRVHPSTVSNVIHKRGPYV